MQTTDDASLWRRLRESPTGLFENAGFRRLFAAGMVSRTGDAVYFVAATWLVFDLTGSTLFTGVTVALSRLPAVGSVFLGPLVDRARLERLLPAVELLQGVVVVIVPVAAVTGHLSVWLVLAVVTTVATLRRVNAPAAQAALPRLLDEEQLAQANSVYSSTRQALGALAESAAGALIALVGAVALFAVDAATFAASTVVYAALAVPAVEVERSGDETDERDDGTDERAEPDERDDETDERVEPDERDGETDEAERSRLTLSAYVADIREGVATIRGSPLRHAVAGAMLANVGTGLGTAVLPAFGDAVGGAGAYGLLLAATTAGTLVGSVIAARFEDRSLGSVVVGGFLVAGVGRVAAVVVETPAAVFVAFGVAAVPLGVYNVLVSTVVQVGVPNRLVARVSSTNGTCWPSSARSASWPVARWAPGWTPRPSSDSPPAAISCWPRGGWSCRRCGRSRPRAVSTPARSIRPSE